MVGIDKIITAACENPANALFLKTEIFSELSLIRGFEEETSLTYIHWSIVDNRLFQQKCKYGFLFDIDE